MPLTSFFEHTCHKCGLMDEARFVFSGPHIKQVCNGCGFYVKFFDKARIPDVKEIKIKTYYIASKDLFLIDKAKKQVEFVDGLTGLNQKMMYWKLYLKVREFIQKGITA